MTERLSARRIARHAYDAGFRGKALETAVAVALAESGGDPHIRGDTAITDGKWGPSVGVWQIRSLHADRGTGRTRDELANLRPATNARHAHAIWRERGGTFTDWAAYTNDAYRDHLGRAQTAVRALHHSGGSGHDGEDHHRQRGGHRDHGGADGSGRPGDRAGRIVLDLAELAALERLMASSQDRVAHSLSTVHTISTDLDRLRAGQHGPGATLIGAPIGALCDLLTGPAGLPMVMRHLDFEERLVHRTRTLAENADGGDGRFTRGDTIAFLRRVTRDARVTLPETAVLEALIAGGLRLGHRRHACTAPHRTHTAPERVRLPARQQMNPGNPVPASLARFANGRLPSRQLAAVGDGEQLWNTAARQFRRMDAAARAAGIDLHVNSGYRSYQEQAVLYDRYRNHGGPLAAAPGRSNHGWGLSADIDVRNPQVLRWLRSNAARFGFFPDVGLDVEPWHWTYRPR